MLDSWIPLAKLQRLGCSVQMLEFAAFGYGDTYSPRLAQIVPGRLLLFLY